MLSRSSAVMRASIFVQMASLKVLGVVDDRVTVTDFSA